MAITLNHTIVPVHAKVVSAEFFAHIFGLKCEGAIGHFVPVRVNETLTLDFDNRDHCEMQRYALQVSEVDFDAIFARIKQAGIPYGSGPCSQEDSADQQPAWRTWRLFQG
jgi:hypothetical protein